MRPILLPLSCALAVTLSACGGGGASSEQRASLDGEWVLTSGTGPAGDVEVSEVSDITLTIDGQEWGGQVCNHYGAQDVRVGDGTVTIGDVPRTEMACLDERIMRAEAAYLAAFIAVRDYEVDDDQLRLTGDGVELVYAAVEPVASPELIGTVWVLDTLFEGPGPDGTARSTSGEPATLELGDDGTLVGSSGCQTREDGTYEVAGDRLLVTFAADHDDCVDEETAAQDTHVWQVLEGDPTFELDGQRLTLWAGELGLGYLPSDATTSP